MRKILLILFVLSLGILATSCKKAEAPTKKFTIAVIPKGTTHEFWKSIHAGSNKAASELTAQGTTIEVIWKGPLREDDREQQIQVVEGFAAQGVNGIVLAPLDNRDEGREEGMDKSAVEPLIERAENGREEGDKLL